MTLVYYSDRFLQHQTGRHPEQPGRLEAIRDKLEPNHWFGGKPIKSWDSLTNDKLAALHDNDYIDALVDLADRGGGQADADTVVSPDSVDVARLAAGAAVDATRRVIAGKSRSALCLVRPPGHHALHAQAMGFCLFGNVALAAQHAVQNEGIERVLVVDWDVHHGNGTQSLFYDDPRVAVLSMHRYPFWPGSGAEDETGTGDGLGATCNIPTEMGTSRDRILSRFARSAEEFADRHRPELVIVSAGFDAHRTDPIGGLGLEIDDFETLTDTVLNIAAAHANDRVVAVLEGGYEPPVLAECVATHLQTLVERENELTAAE